MRVAVEGEDTSGANRQGREIVIDILPVRIAVDFHRDIRARGRFEHLFPIRRDAGPCSVLPASRMPENVDARCRHRLDHARGLIRRGPQPGMRGGHHDFELAQFSRRHVHRSIGANIRLDAFEQPERAAGACIDAIDLTVLLEQAVHRHPARNGQAVGMVRHRAELISAGDSRPDDVVERLGSVAPGGVHLQIATVIGEARSLQPPILQGSDHLRPAQKMTAQSAAPVHVHDLIAPRNRLFNGGRSAGLQHLEDDA